MDCKAWENEIARREADLLDAGQQKALSAHLTTCALCGAVSDRVRQGIREISAMPVVQAPRDFLEDSWRRIQRAAPAPTSPLERFKKWLGSLNEAPVWLPLGAAAIVIGAIIVVPALRDGGGVQVAQARYRVISQDGAVKVERSPNGGAVLATNGGRLAVEHLGRATYTLSGSGNRLTVAMGRPDAIELAAGTADVKVAADPGHPYAVEIGGARVVVTGTLFRLTAGGHPQVELKEGKVRVDGPDWHRDLAPGEKLSWSDAGPDAAPAAPGAAPSAAPPSSAAPAALPSVKAPAPKPLTGAKPAGAPAPAPSPKGATGVASPAASPASATGAGETETSSAGQLNDPFQGH